MLQTVTVLFAGLGATMIIFALAFVTLLVGALVNAMVVLIAGPILDRFVKEPAPPSAG